MSPSLPANLTVLMNIDEGLAIAAIQKLTARERNQLITKLRNISGQQELLELLLIS